MLTLQKWNFGKPVWRSALGGLALGRGMASRTRWQESGTGQSQSLQSPGVQDLQEPAAFAPSLISANQKIRIPCSCGILAKCSHSWHCLQACLAVVTVQLHSASSAALDSTDRSPSSSAEKQPRLPYSYRDVCTEYIQQQRIQRSRQMWSAMLVKSAGRATVAAPLCESTQCFPQQPHGTEASMRTMRCCELVARYHRECW